ncbi:MAG: acetyl/propionyl/methylcrotonyl-CoA carboxylase subunit alpha, partial [Alphaproteobacteria bacterium]|nr:acetyl/propionyl/methylcrotonyl-CoA carboxylase subunit alpha [Alphaproteobacteria bacterium]
MFKKILIANRGEIACRVIKTARRMGIKTVAVYSDADKDALHVEMADEAVHIGPPPAAQSYLVIEKIIDACRKTGAEAVHPGYGFLSERTAFAEALSANGIAFLGPNPKAIFAMGDKIESKKLAAAAKVNTVPGFIGEIDGTEHAARIAAEIGYPVMVKASAGGGGKGLRVCNSAEELAQAILSSQNEARASFGDDRIFIEKFVTEPRHIEIQVLGDKHGNCIYLNERECSIQRRHQKVIEEAPSPFLDAATRKAMGEQAVALAKAVGYDSAGTVEFIVDGQRNFYFLEMNTRLQVEHPVTELITGIDLVEQMIRVGYGEKLAIAQSDVKIDGWAVESRIYAEDPYRNFLPSIGRLVKYRPPAEGPVGKGLIRNDTGVFEGGEISMFYDPMIAKLCTHAPTRAEAIALQADALDAFYIEGIQHNVPFLQAVMGHQRFKSGNITTGFIAEEFPDGFDGVELPHDAAEKLAAVAVFAHARDNARAREVTGRIHPNSAYPPEWVVNLAGQDHALSVWLSADPRGPMTFRFHDGDQDGFRDTIVAESAWVPGENVFSGLIDGAPFVAQIVKTMDGYRLWHRGASVSAKVLTPVAAALSRHMIERVAPDTSKFLLCPMPGLVVSINVEEGQEVKAGEPLAVVEAMKMENVLRAEKDATIAKINAKKGD